MNTLFKKTKGEHISHPAKIMKKSALPFNPAFSKIWLDSAVCLYAGFQNANAAR